MTEVNDAMPTPPGWDDAPLPKRNGHKGLLPGTWLNRELRIEYIDAAGKATTTTAVLLDWFPFGPVLNMSGTRSLVAWERVTLIELVGD